MTSTGILSVDGAIALVTLSAMEIVLGIDNIVFVSILVSRVPERIRESVRRAGIGLALISRLALLFSISWIMKLNKPLFFLRSRSFTGHDLILLAGGLFLIYKATREIHEKVEGDDREEELRAGTPGKNVGWILVQIMVIDIVFSLDSVITAVGMAQDLTIMVSAMLIAVGTMLAFAKHVGEFVLRHPTIKILALSFLLLIGVLLVAEGMGVHVDKGYIYFAMAFSLGVEMLNLRYRKKRRVYRR